MIENDHVSWIYPWNMAIFKLCILDDQRVISMMNFFWVDPHLRLKKTVPKGLSSFSWLRRAVADQRAKSYLPGKPPRFWSVLLSAFWKKTRTFTRHLPIPIVSSGPVNCFWSYILAHLDWRRGGFRGPACAVLINLAKATTSLSCHERNIENIGTPGSSIRNQNGFLTSRFLGKILSGMSEPPVIWHNII